jgi:multidrug resistance efflux pump
LGIIGKNIAGSPRAAGKRHWSLLQNYDMRDRQKLPPIPTLSRVRWREFRLRVVPFIVFITIVFGVVVAWRQAGVGGTVGLAEGTCSMITSPRTGMVTALDVEPYQWIDVGGALATVSPDDPRSELQALQTQLELARIQLQPSLADRNAINYERVRIDASAQRTAIAMAKVNLDRAEPALKRNEQLLKEDLISQEIYEASLRDRDFYVAEIKERTQALQEIEERLKTLWPLGQFDASGTNPAALGLIEDLRATISTVISNSGPMKLVAPTSGMVGMVRRHPGEYVVLGEPLVSIESSQCERIVAYLRQPFPFEPRVGMHVNVSTRTRPRHKFITEIARVGVRMEAITNALVIARQGFVELGLPIVLSVPRNPAIRPGEIVDIYTDSEPLHLFGPNSGTNSEKNWVGAFVPHTP